MNELKLIKSEHFGEIECDLYQNGADICMTSEQLGACLGYSDRKGVDKLVERNPYLKEKEFSTTVVLSVVEGGRKVARERRIFTEDGIYEVTMLAKTETAKKFRAWFRQILKALRTGKAKLVGMTDYQQMMADTRRQNIAVQKARLLNQMAAEYQGTYHQILQAYATKELTGEFLLPLPSLPERTYTAEEIGVELGISANMVGRLANANNLKTDQYGSWFADKAKHANKEVPSFRYFGTVVPVLREIIQKGGSV